MLTDICFLIRNILERLKVYIKIYLTFPNLVIVRVLSCHFDKMLSIADIGGLDLEYRVGLLGMQVR